MKPTLLLTIILLPFMFMGHSCNSDDYIPNMQSIAGIQWKLYGFYEVRTGNLSSPKPEDCPECYVITFSNGKWNGHSSTNVLKGGYSINLKMSVLQLNNISGTEINELFGGSKYIEALHAVYSYELTMDYLKLFYDKDGDYLIFHKAI